MLELVTLADLAQGTESQARVLAIEETERHSPFNSPHNTLYVKNQLRLWRVTLHLVNRLRIVWEYQIHDDDPEELPINFICRITGKFHEETLTINQYIIEWVDLESLIDDLIT